MCRGSVTANHNKDYKDVMVAALTANPAEFSSVIGNNGVLVTLMNDGLVRSLDDLVAKHGQSLNPSQLVTVDGKVMAIAFMANAQHLFYRADILSKAGVAAPTTYEEVLAAAEAIKAAGLMEHPFAINTKAGWNLGEEFVNMYMGSGGEFFKAGTAEVSINNEKGAAALKMMKDLSAYMNPDFLTHDSNATSAEWKAGNVALMNMWGSRVGPLRETEGSSQVVVDNTSIDAPMTVGGGNTPATTLWWDGWTVYKNISDDELDAKITDEYDPLYIAYT